jgi:hypothetical protein
MSTFTAARTNLLHANTIILVAVALPCVFLTLRRAHSRWRSRKRFRLRAVPCAGANDEVLLEILNKGADVTLRAKVWITDCSPGLGFMWQRHTGRWRHAGSEYREDRFQWWFRTCQLPKYCDEMLLIATMENSFGPNGNTIMRLAGSTDTLSWEPHEAALKPLPFFVINVSLTADEYSNTIVLTYKVGPRTPFGPLGMQLIS